MKRWAIFVMVAVLGHGSAAWGGEKEQGHGGGHGGTDAKPHWGYTGVGAPQYWGDLATEFAACKEGHSQSPIDIRSAEDVEQPEIQFSYESVPVRIVNNGHTIQVNCPLGSTIAFQGQTYHLLQFHFHTLSENAVNGRLYPMEVHLVHKDNAGKLAVVGVLFEEGKENPFLEKIWRSMPMKAESDTVVSTLRIEVADMLPENRDYFSWEGSLTTPPCTEGVKWMLLKNPVEVSADQVKKLERAMHGCNNRPVQPLYGRMVYE